jgi:polyisoprenoid-binding protein YceI
LSLAGPTNVASSGGTAAVSVTAQPECTWSVFTQAGWVSDFSPAAGQGNGAFEFRVAANAANSPREGEILVNDARLRIAQEGAPCHFSLAPQDETAPPAGTSGRITVTAPAGCAWTAMPSAPWITIESTASGSGNGTVSYRIAANNGTSGRNGTIAIGDRQFAVAQAAAMSSGPAASCTVVLGSMSQDIGASGGEGVPIAVTAPAGCPWTAVSTASWITVTSGASWTGNGTVGFSVAANTGASRNGAMTIGGQMFTVAQAAGNPCSYAINPTSTSVGAATSNGSVNVSAGDGCGWTATSNASWLTITSADRGSGNGIVRYSVATNGGASRSGTLSIAGETLTITQAAAAPACSYTIDPASASVGAGASNGSVNVSAGNGCGWTATSNASWLTITSADGGSGNGTVRYSVAANSGAARNGTLSIAGETLTITQAAAAPACSYTIDPTSASVEAGASNGSVSVTAGSGCAWTATSNASWMTITSGGSGSGNGTVRYNIVPNSGAARNGTMSIAGGTLTVMQAAAQTCSYTIDPTSTSVGAGASNGSVSVTAGSGCAWTATSSASWMTITSGGSGSGNGTVRYSVATNDGAARSDSLTIAGHTFTVSQAAAAPPCTYSVDPTSFNVSGADASYSVTVTVASGCAWTAERDADWIRIESGARGSGNGTVTFSVREFKGSQRSGNLTVAGHTVSVTQSR